MTAETLLEVRDLKVSFRTEDGLIQARIRPLLPDPVPLATEENTGGIPVVRE